MPIATSPGSAISGASVPWPRGGSKDPPIGARTRGALRSYKTHIANQGGLFLAEFLAIHQSDATLLGCVLRRLAGRVSLGSSERAAGVGFFQSDDLLLRKRPLGGQAALPEKLAEGVESEATLICSGTAGSSSRSFNEQITLPFRFKRWLFATAGQPDSLAPIRPALVKGLPDYLRRSVKGDSAAEGLFFTFLSRLRDVGRLDDHELDAETAARSLRDRSRRERARSAREVAPHPARGDGSLRSPAQRRVPGRVGPRGDRGAAVAHGHPIALASREED